MSKCPHCGAEGYAEGGQVRDDVLGQKREADLPEYQLPVYRGETAKQEAAEPHEDEDKATLAAELRKRQKMNFSRLRGG